MSSSFGSDCVILQRSGDRALELGGTMREGVFGREASLGRCGVLGRLMDVLRRCMALGCGVVGRLGMRGVRGRLDCKLFGV